MPIVRNRTLPWSAVAAVYLILALIYTWPVPWLLTTHLPHDAGDPVVSTTLLHWNVTRTPFTREWWNGVGYYPAANTVAFSDPRLGLTLLAAPVYWLTGSMIAGYNTAFILSFALSALAAHLLGYALTRSHLSAAIAGCAYGFAVFRAAHLAHLELLASYWMPIALLALHRWLETRQRRWLAAFGAALVAQGLFCAYYLPMLGILTGAWLLWFAFDRARPWRLAGPILAAGAAVAVLLPLFLTYRTAHAEAGFTRSAMEVEFYSADVSGLWSAPAELRLWPSSAPTRHPEGQIFPGVAVLALGAWYLRATWRRTHTAGRARRLRQGLLAVAGLGVLVAVAAAAWGPMRFELGIFRLSISDLRKPITVALAALTAFAALDPRVRESARRRSVMGFYLLGALLMFLLALGPNPTAFGKPFLYLAPYSWLMPLPGFDSLRAPGRFGMPLALMLAVAAALAWQRLRPSLRLHPGRATILLGAVIVAEAWIAPATVVEPPGTFDWPRECAGLPRLELPFRGLAHGAAAQHRAMLDGVRSVNGLTGFVPPFVEVLELASKSLAPEAIAPVAPASGLCVVVNGWYPRSGEIAAWVASHGGATRLPSPGRRRFFLLHGTPPPDPPAGEPLRFSGVRARGDEVDVRLLTDGDRATAWMTKGAQNQSAYLTVALECRADVTGIELSQGAHALSYPRVLSVEVARRRGGWRRVWEGETTARLVEGAIRRPRLAPIAIPVSADNVNRVRIRVRQHDRARWAVAELRITGRCRDEGGVDGE